MYSDEGVIYSDMVWRYPHIVRLIRIAYGVFVCGIQIRERVFKYPRLVLCLIFRWDNSYPDVPLAL